MKLWKTFSESIFSILVVMSWVSFFIIPLQWALPIMALVVLLALGLGSKDDRSMAMVSLVAIALYSWYGVRILEHKIVSDAFVVHRDLIGCYRHDRFVAYANHPKLQANLPKPSDEAVVRCKKLHPLSEEGIEFQIDMEERGWGKWHSGTNN